MSETASRPPRDWAPWLILPVVALVTLPLMQFSTWVTLTVAGAAMGTMLFLMASGLTLVFGLMDVLNFAHGAFVTIGAYLAVSVLGSLAGLSAADSLALNLLALAAAVAAGAAVTGGVGFLFERIIIRRVYGSHLQQILITMGGLIVASQLVIAIWGAQPLLVPKPVTLRGSLLLGGSAIESYRLAAVALGLLLFAVIHTVLNRTRIGLLVRAGVENREMVEALGFRIHRLFIAVFVAGAALAGIGGVMWGVYQEIVTAAIGDEMTVLIFITVIIGGLGSITGCFQAAILVGLTTNYVGYLTPKLALGSNIALMVVILLWRPRGLFPDVEAMNRLISGDRPGHPVATVLVLALLLALAFAPFLFPGTRSLAAASRICIFIVLAASYDMLLGYTGIVSFAHTMFFAIGAYAVAIPLSRNWEGWTAIVSGTIAGAAIAAAVAGLIALLSLRVRKIFFSMITLAVASLAQILATQWRDVTGGEDGLTFSLPRLLGPGFRPFDNPVLGVRIDGRLVTYYLIFLVALALFLVMLRIVNSSFGRVLQAIRENEFRAEALGYRVVVYRTIASAQSAAIAAAAGALMAILLRYTGPQSTLSFEIMVDVLLMVVIGGMGTLYGPALGATVIVLAQYYLQPALQAAADAFAGLPLLPALFHPDRWLLWLGVLFILIVYFLPAGIVGTLRKRAA